MDGWPTCLAQLKEASWQRYVTRFWFVATVTVLLSLSLWQSFMHLWWPPFRGLHLTPLQRQFNTAMSSVRASVEWVFGDIINYFSFIDFKKNLKLGLSAVGKMYIVCALLTNARSCLYPTSTSGFFNLGTQHYKSTLRNRAQGFTYIGPYILSTHPM